MADPELLDLDAVAFADYWTSVLDEVAAAVPDARTVVDLGSGTGTGALGFARRFPDAQVIAVDSSEEMLAAITAKGGRVTTQPADLDAGWPAITEVDITFASMSLHHVTDPDRLLRQLHAATRPGGVVAAAEFREPVRVLRDEVGDGVEARAVATMHARHPQLDLQADWPARLREAGFEVVTERHFDLDIPAPLDADAQRYAQLWLDRIAHHLGDEFPELRRRTGPADFHLHGRRTLTIARKPGSRAA